MPQPDTELTRMRLRNIFISKSESDLAREKFYIACSRWQNIIATVIECPNHSLTDDPLRPCVGPLRGKPAHYPDRALCEHRDRDREADWRTGLRPTGMLRGKLAPRLQTQ